ncbi:MAG TPA: M23 family metallopeptidase [Drouetiella sp.]
MKIRKTLSMILVATTIGAATSSLAAQTSKEGVNARINPASEPPLSRAETDKLIHSLREKKLDLPLKGFEITRMKGSFYETHGGVQHGAADLLAARGTPVLAVEDGKIDKLFLSKAGGITIYESDPSRRFIYYYAHLEKYAPKLHDGQVVHRGEVIGYVGTSGNAPKNTPHLHFSIGLAQAPGKWWVTSSIDPYEVYK